MRDISAVCVFCGSSDGADPRFRGAAESLGSLLAREGICMVYGGGNRGLMGVAAHAAMNAGGSVVGVMPEAMRAREGHADFVTELRVVNSMHERKAQMEALSDGFVTMPGGIGTLEELGEMFTWQQLGLHAKPLVILNVAGYYDSLLAMLDQMVQSEFLQASNRTGVCVALNAEDAIAQLRAMPVPESYPFLWRQDS